MRIHFPKMHNMTMRVFIAFKGTNFIFIICNNSVRVLWSNQIMLFLFVTDSLDVDILTAYLIAHPRVFPEAEGRIKFEEIDEKSKTNRASVSQSQLTLLFLGLWFVYRRMSL